MPAVAVHVAVAQLLSSGGAHIYHFAVKVHDHASQRVVEVHSYHFFANLYHFGESELWIGEWMELRGNRDQLVIATKYTGWGDGEKKDVNACGNSGKSMMLGIKESLKRLRTDYVDIFYVHFW